MKPTDKRALIAIDLGAESCRVSLLRWLPGDMPQRIHDQLIHRGFNGISIGAGNAPAMTAMILHSLARATRRCCKPSPR